VPATGNRDPATGAAGNMRPASYVLYAMNARELMTDYLGAARRGDWETAFGYFAEDMHIRIPGRSAWAGERRGKELAVGYIQSVRDRYRNGRIELELIDMLAGDERVALLVRERFHGDGPPVEIRRANVYTVRNDEIVEISIFEGDQYAVDELLH
jgi:ketosteroid isomerase-like protein